MILKDSISQLLVQSTIVAQHACYGDGGLLSAILASRLVLDTLDIAGSHAARLKFISAYEVILEWVSELAENADAEGKAYDYSKHGQSSGLENSHLQREPHCSCCSVVLSLKDAGAQAYVAVVRNVIASKQVSFVSKQEALNCYVCTPIQTAKNVILKHHISLSLCSGCRLAKRARRPALVVVDCSGVPLHAA